MLSLENEINFTDDGEIFWSKCKWLTNAEDIRDTLLPLSSIILQRFPSQIPLTITLRAARTKFTGAECCGRLPKFGSRPAGSLNETVHYCHDSAGENFGHVTGLS